MHPSKSSQPHFCAQNRCRRQLPRPYAHVWPLIGRGETGRSEDAKTPLCTTWRYAFARSRWDPTICVAKGGACSSRFLFRKAASDLWRPGSALLRREPYRWWREKTNSVCPIRFLLLFTMLKNILLKNIIIKSKTVKRNKVGTETRLSGRTRTKTATTATTTTTRTGFALLRQF